MTRFLLSLVLLFSTAAILTVAQAPQGITIRAGTLLDGRGGSQQNVVLRIDGGKIVSVGKAGGPVTYDLSKYTLLPGFIDTHVHILWHFGKDGRFDNTGETPEDRIKAGIENARATVMSGFTTVQSVGERADLDLRAALEKDNLPGPRILTSVRQLNERTGAQRGQRGAPPVLGTPEQLREAVREAKTAGADLIKLFASASIRDGGKQTMTDEQLQAACGEANALNLRTLVHAHSAESMKAAILAGCTQMEHGTFASDEVLKMMADRGVYFDPNIGLVLQNYLENKAKFLGIGNYNEEGFAYMEKGDPDRHRDLQARAEDAEAEDRLRHRRGRGGARAQHRGSGGPGEGRRAEADGRDRLADVALGRVAADEGPDRRDRAGPPGGPGRRRGRSAGRHHRAAAGDVRDERREGLPLTRRGTASAIAIGRPILGRELLQQLLLVAADGDLELLAHPLGDAPRRIQPDPRIEILPAAQKAFDHDDVVGPELVRAVARRRRRAGRRPAPDPRCARGRRPCRPRDRRAAAAGG